MDSIRNLSRISNEGCLTNLLGEGVCLANSARLAPSPRQHWPAGGYLYTGALHGAKHFALWPLSQAAQSCFGSESWPDHIPVPQEPKGIEGTLAIMVGASKEAFAKAEPLLKCMGSSVTLTGAVGAGNTTKLANQIMVACNIAAMGEALSLATRCGLNPEVVLNAVKGGLAGSAVLNAKGPMLIARNFKPGFKIELHQKDLRNALQTAEANRMFLPMTAFVQQMLLSLMGQGKGEFDHSAIATFVEQVQSRSMSEWPPCG